MDPVPHPADEGTATEKDFAWVCGELPAKAQVGASPPNSQLLALLPDAVVAPSEAQQTPRHCVPKRQLSGLSVTLQGVRRQILSLTGKKKQPS